VVFDRAQALATTGDDPELLREIVALFLEDCPRMVKDIEVALAAADCESAARAAHTLKGSVAVLGACALAAAARDVEQTARKDDLEAAAGAFRQVADEADRLVPVLEALLAP
jgi:HPt (histidine-containing phosphotransfer) domain-containing protein